ncbi:MAG: thiamine-phosphate kinase [Burkholderiales bacterium]|nr:thiamine-phosphate kinase [Burkholderiales bacterium]
MNEFELIRRFFNRPSDDPAVRLSVGDDAAIIVPSPECVLVISVDTLNEGRHFFADVAPASLGHKVLAVNLSDIAAMGAMPRWALLSSSIPDSNTEWLDEFTRGFYALADRYRVALIGGDTVRGTRSFTVTIIGETSPDAALTRHGAQVGDDIWVSGTLGDAALALAILTRQIILGAGVLSQMRKRLETPQPRVELGLQLRGVATAALDISDGLIGDLRHILDASAVGAYVDLATIPRSPILDRLLNADARPLALHCLLAGGDDYELCFTAPPSKRNLLENIGKNLTLSLSRIGVITKETGLVILDERQRILDKPPHAFDHFLSTDRKL